MLSPATVNKDLRHLMAVLRIAQDWAYLSEMPRFRMVREVEEIGRVMDLEDYRMIYEGCHHARRPASCAEDWWRALLVFGITTGWRIGEILALRREDLDLETGIVKTRGKDNKGKRDDTDRLPVVTLEHIRKIVSFSPLVFDWPHDRRTLDTEFHRIQTMAGIELDGPDSDSHECTDACHRCGFHSLRRGYATLNVDMGLPVLQRNMRHKSPVTTQRYIQLRDKVLATAETVYVPEFLGAKKVGC